MAWELQTHMHGWVAPSIWHTAKTADQPEVWLAERWADQRWDESTGADAYDALVEKALEIMRDVGDELLVDAIALHAIENENSTTNGGHEVYLDGWTSVPWCSEDQYQEWYA